MCVFRDSRGEEQRAVHQRAVVVVADEVVHLGGLITRLGPVGGPDVHGIVGVVEVDDVNVKDEHSRWWDDVTWVIKRSFNYKMIFHENL